MKTFRYSRVRSKPNGVSTCTMSKSFAENSYVLDALLVPSCRIWLKEAILLAGSKFDILTTNRQVDTISEFPTTTAASVAEAVVHDMRPTSVRTVHDQARCAAKLRPIVVLCRVTFLQAQARTLPPKSVGNGPIRVQN